MQLRNSRDNRKSQLDYVFSHGNCTYLINDESTFHRTQLSDNNYRAITRQSRVNHVLVALVAVAIARKTTIGRASPSCPYRTRRYRGALMARLSRDKSLDVYRRQFSFPSFLFFFFYVRERFITLGFHRDVARTFKAIRLENLPSENEITARKSRYYRS